MSPIPARATLYHYRTDEKTAGPVSKEVIDTLAAAGKLYAAATLFFCFGIVIFFLTNHAELEVIILIPCILVFMGKLLCYVHTLVEKCGITAAPGRE